MADTASAIITFKFAGAENPPLEGREALLGASPTTSQPAFTISCTPPQPTHFTNTNTNTIRIKA